MLGEIIESAKRELWLIWSNEHKAWWGHCHRGYSTDVMEAGTYTYEEAIKICESANCYIPSDAMPNETMLPVNCHGMREATSGKNK